MSTHPYETVRGLVGFTQFIDTYGNKVLVQESSDDEFFVQDGARLAPNPNISETPSHCWLRIEGKESSASAHLDTQMATELILALAEFIGRVARLRDPDA